MNLQIIIANLISPRDTQRILASHKERNKTSPDPALELEQQELPEGYKPPVGIDLIAEELENKGYLP